MSSSFQPKLAALLTAARSRDSDSALSIWRDMSHQEQEDVLAQLLARLEDPAEATAPLPSAGRSEPHTRVQGDVEEAAPAAAGETELVPVSVDILHELSASSHDVDEGPHELLPESFDVAAYRSRWIQRWKWSALVAAWGSMTVFAFTGDVSGFGPTEWIVATLMNVVGGGLLVGTLLNFAVAAIPTQDAKSPPTEKQPLTS